MLLSTDTSVKVQHEAVRNAAGWYDFTHKLLEVTGEDSSTFLDKMYVNSIAKMKIGSAKYTLMLNDNGLIIDDVVIFRFDENTYWVSTLFCRDVINWFDAHKGKHNIEYSEITPDWRMYAVQGPNSKGLVNAVLEDAVDDMKFFTIRDNKIEDLPVKVARCGYTGEKWGYEIYVATENAGLVEEKLAENEKEFGAMHITEIDVICMTLAAEKGFVLMIDIRDTNPFEIHYDTLIDWSKDFIGKAALEKIRGTGPRHQLLGFTVDDNSALIYGGPLGYFHGSRVIKDGTEVGKVTKFTHGFSVGKNIGYAYVDITKVAIGDVVTINDYEAIITKRGILK